MIAIYLSIALAVAHGMIEVIFIILEKTACKTDFLHYTIICFNGRFGWVPFTNHFTSAVGISESNQSKKKMVFDYENIESSLCCLSFKLDYYFTNETLESLTKALTNLPVQEDKTKRYDVRVGMSMRKASYENFLRFLEVACVRVNLIIDDVPLDRIVRNQTNEEDDKELAKVI